LLGSLWWLLVAVLTAIGIVLYWPLKVLIRWVRFRLGAPTTTEPDRAADDDPDDPRS
jgi:hypothetical protein